MIADVDVDSEPTILVVDDEESIVRLFVRALTAAGYQDVTGMTDATQVPGYLDEETPDLVLLDLNMPGLDGFALLEDISGRLSEDAFLPVMAVSGASDPDTRERAFASGAKDFLAKPVDLQELLLHVRSLLETRFLSLRLQKTQEELAGLVGRRTEELQKSVARTQQAEEALRLSEEQYRLLAETSGAGVLLVSPDGVILFANDVAASFLGKDPEELIGTSASAHAPESEQTEVLKAQAHVLATGEPRQFEQRYLSLDGNVRWILSTYSRVTNNNDGVQGVQVISVDITERKEAEASLLLTQLSLDKSADAVFWFDIHGSILYTNESCREMYGYSAEEMEELTVFDMTPGLTPEGYAEEWQAIREQGSVNFSALPRRKNGESFHADITKTHLNHHGQELDITIVRDVTDLHMVDIALRSSENRLSHMFRSLSSGVIIYGPGSDGNTLVVYDMNPAAERIYRKSKDSCIGRTLDEAFCFLRVSGASDIIERVHRTGLPESRSGVMINDGADMRLWLNQSAYTLPSGEVVSIFDDVTEKREAMDQLEEAYGDLRRAQSETLRVLGSVTEQRDPYTAGHQQRVAQIALLVGQKLGLSPERLEALRAAAMVHDVGKVAVPIEILSSPGFLSNTQIALVREHVESGYDILKSITFDWPIAKMVEQHHERLDGSGYPKGLKGDEIMLEARILAVADVAEAMISHRPYRPARGVEAALDELTKNAGRLYDAEVVDALLEVDLTSLQGWDRRTVADPPPAAPPSESAAS